MDSLFVPPFECCQRLWSPQNADGVWALLKDLGLAGALALILSLCYSIGGGFFFKKQHLNS